MNLERTVLSTVLFGGAATVVVIVFPGLVRLLGRF